MVDQDLARVFNDLAQHFEDCDTDCIDDEYFTRFNAGTILEMYAHMEQYTSDGIIICNIIFQAIKISDDPHIIMNGVKAIDYQGIRGKINDNLWRIVWEKAPQIDLSELGSDDHELWMNYFRNTM